MMYDVISQVKSIRICRPAQRISVAVPRRSDVEAGLRVLQVSACDFGGGAENVAWNLFQAYRARGYGAWLAVGCKQSDDPDVFLVPNDAYRSWWARMWLRIGALVQPLVEQGRGLERFRNIHRWVGEPGKWLDLRRGYEDFHFPGTRRLLMLTLEPPDIVHCHNLHGGYFDLRVFPWLSQQVPLLLTLHDAWLLSGHCAHSFDCQRWKTGCGHCPDLTIYPAIRRDATAYNWQRKRNIYEMSRLYITTPSQWLMDKVQASMLCGIQYKVIPNAVDLTVFRPGSQVAARRALDLPDNAKIVLLVAHNMFKDYDTMEAALSQLDKSNGAELMFICLGKTGADKLVGQGRMIYRGFERDQKRMALYYRAADVFIHAAKEETFGKTVTEALACGVPVVATDVGGVAEQLEDGKGGFLVSPGDSHSMSAAIRRLLTDSDLRSSMGQAGVAISSRRFGLESQVNAFLAWYQEILKDWEQNQSHAPNPD